MLKLSTFGALRVRSLRGGQAVLGNGKPAALLVYIALTPGMHRRDELAELFWPDEPKGQMRASFRQAIIALRNAMVAATGSSWLVSTRHTLGFDPSHEHEIDAFELVRLSQQTWPPVEGDTASDPDELLLARMGEMADGYRRPFLSDLKLSDCPAFTHWQLAYRVALQQRALELLERLADIHEQSGHPRLALPYALRIIELAPDSEPGYRRAMALYALNGQPEAAMRQYETFRRALERDDAGTPSRELREFAEGISAGGFSAPAAMAPLSLQPGEERRQVSVLFCQIDCKKTDNHEAVAHQQQLHQALARRVVAEFSGHSVEYYGGGLLAFFGYPNALHNNAMSAVRAAQVLGALATEAVDVRLGVHSGLIVTSQGSAFPDPIGLTSGVAIRLHRQAQSGEVVISAQTQRHVSGFIPVKGLNAEMLSGLANMPTAFKALPKNHAASCLAAIEELPALVGRERELALLEQRWLAARDGRLGAVLLCGEAGVGKSRLVSELLSRLDRTQGVARQLRCSPEGQQVPLQPLLDCIKDLCGLSQVGSLEQKRGNVQAFLDARAPHLRAQGLELLFSALDLFEPLAPAPALPVAQRLKTATHQLLVEVFIAIASSEPLLLVIEDLHWASKATLAVLSQLVARARGKLPILLVFTARTDFSANWRGLKTVSLRRLRNEAMGVLVRSINAGLPAIRVDSIAAHARGIPLFAEALALLPMGDELPANLDDLLATQLAALEADSGLAQLAATFGREFEPGLLAKASGLPERQLISALQRLHQKAFIQRLANGRWQFRHALFQAALYRSQDEVARQAAHLRIAEVLEAHAPQVTRECPLVMALHCAAAGNTGSAAEYRLRAADSASRLFAFEEAHEHYHSGLQLLDSVPSSAWRSGIEFSLLVGLARAEQALGGRGKHRGFEYLERAFILHAEGAGAGGGLALFKALWGLWESTALRQGFREGSHIALRLVDVAEHEAEQRLLQQAHFALGSSLFWCGELELSRRHLDLSLSFEPTPAPYDIAALTRDDYGHITLVTASAYSFLLRWLEGWTEKAIAECCAAQALARDCGDALSLAFITTLGAFLYRWEGNIDEARRLALEGREWSVASHSSVFTAANSSILGWADVLQDEPAALGHLKRGIDTIRDTRNRVAVALLAPYAEALLHLNEVEQAGLILDEAIKQSEQFHDLHFLAELMRLKGHCLHRAGHHGAALASVDRAIAISQRQGARQLELRARASRMRLGDASRG